MMIRINPKERLNVCKLLKHPFVTEDYPSNLEISIISSRRTHKSIRETYENNNENNNLEDSKASINE